MTYRILQGHVIDQLRSLPHDSVHCVVTSPPYWGLRDYKIPPSVWGGDIDCPHLWVTEEIEREMRCGLGLKDSPASTRGGAIKCAEVGIQSFQRGECQICGAWRGCLGQEPTPELYIRNMVEVFREVRRVLRSDGTAWVNLGDSYANNSQSGGGDPTIGVRNLGGTRQPKLGVPNGLKPKDLVGIPWRLAFALQADGWWLRQEIVWSKPNPMPESVTDRCTKSHEYLFLLTKSARYFFDQQAILEPVSPNTHARLSQDVEAQIVSARAHGGQKTNGNMKAVGRSSWKGSLFHTGKTAEHQLGRSQKNRKLAEAGSGTKSNRSFDAAMALRVEKRNKRSVWNIATQPYSEAHFATFPVKLVEPCILAGTSEHGVCSVCGAPWKREIESNSPPHDGSTKSAYPKGSTANRLAMLRQAARERGGEYVHGKRTLGWKRTCEHHDAAPAPAVVLDPFSGSGTTGVVALRHGRNYIGVELNPDYVAMSHRRIRGDAPLLNNPNTTAAQQESVPNLETEEVSA